MEPTTTARAHKVSRSPTLINGSCYSRLTPSRANQLLPRTHVGTPEVQERLGLAFGWVDIKGLALRVACIASTVYSDRESVGTSHIGIRPLEHGV